MIEELLPPTVAAVEAFGDLPAATLLPAEQAAVENAVTKRSREFATGRECARRALARMGRPTVAIPVGEHRAPQWPAGVVGSITHCASYCASAVADETDFAAIGIDAEPHEPLPAAVLATVALAEEQSHLRDLTMRAGGIHWDRLLFSTKEAVYKAWFPLTGRWLDFSEVATSIHPETRAFTARLLVPMAGVTQHRFHGFSGRWLIRNNLILTAVAVGPTELGAS